MILGNLIYAVLLGAAGAISLFLVFYAARRRVIAGATWFAVMMSACVVWSFTGVIESLVPSLSDKMFWSQLSYFGIVSVPVAWFLFAVNFCGCRAILKRRISWIFWLVPAATLVIAFTNTWHGWLWSSVVPFSAAAGAPAVYEYGWWIFVHVTYSYLLVLLGIVIFIKTARQAQGLLRRQARLLVWAGLVPMVGSILYVFKINPWPPYDLGPVTFVITGIMISWAIFHWQLLEAAPAAQKTMFAQDVDGEIILDPQNQITAINQSAKKILGMGLIPLGSDGAVWLRRLGLKPSFYEQEKTSQQKVVYQDYHLLVILTPFFRLGDQLGGRIITLRDISAQHQAELARQAEERKFRDIFDLAQDAIFIHDLTGKFIEVNKTACQRLGYPREELLKLSPQKIDAPEFAQNVTAKIAELKKKGSAIFRAIHVTKAGGRIPIELSSQVIDWDGQKAILSIARDLTERLKMEEKIKRDKERLDEMGRIARIGGWELDLETGQQVWTNQVYEIHEVDKKFTPTAENGIKFYAPEARPMITKAVEQAKSDGKSFDLELPFITAKGKKIFVRAIGKPEKINGRIVRLKGVFQDITEQKKAAEALEARVAESERMNRLVEEKSQNLEKFNQLMVGRELRMVELKEELARARERQGDPLVVGSAGGSGLDWSAKFQEGVALEEKMISQLKNTYQAEIEKSNLPAVKKEKALAILRELVTESVGHEEIFKELKDKRYGA